MKRRWSTVRSRAKSNLSLWVSMWLVDMYTIEGSSNIVSNYKNEKQKGKSYFETKRTSAPGRIRTPTLIGETERKISKMTREAFLSKCHFFNGYFQFYSDLLQACHLVRIQDYIKIFHLILVPCSCYLLLYGKNFIEKAHFTKWNSPDMNFISVSANFDVQIWPVFGLKID